MSYSAERLLRIIGIGVAIWLVELLLELALFPLENLSKLWYDSVLWLVFLMLTMIAVTTYFPGVIGDRRKEGWIVGIVWLIIALGCDIGFHLAIAYRQFEIMLYLSTQGWIYLQLPIVAVAAGYLSQAIEESHKQVNFRAKIFVGRR